MDLSVELSLNDALPLIQQINPLTLIGYGREGAVYRINYRGRLAALKIPLDQNQKELEIYKYLCRVYDQCYCRTNIVQMLAYNDSIDLIKGPIIILEFFDGSNLAQYTGYEFSPITYYTHRLLPRLVPGDADYRTLGRFFNLNRKDDIIMHMFKSIYNGLLCLHSRAVTHRDLELKNVLVRSDGKVAIADFGAARLLRFGENYDDFTGLWSVFNNDYRTFGPMMGNFIDSTNDLPFQYRLDHHKDSINIEDLLIRIEDQSLQDLFLVAMEFPTILVFVSFIFYLNLLNNSLLVHSLIDQATDHYNDQMSSTEEINEDEYALKEISNIDKEYIYSHLSVPVPLDIVLTRKLILYSRLVIGSILESVSEDNQIYPNESIYQVFNRIFGRQNYPTIIKAIQDELNNGYLFKNFNLFVNVYSPLNLLLE
jgi:hypothetical protein